MPGEIHVRRLCCFTRVFFLCLVILNFGCSRSLDSAPQKPAPKTRQPSSLRREVRATGTVKAVRELAIQVPRISGQGGRMTLVRLIPNGSQVKEGDLLAEFDRTEQLDKARDALAKYEDLKHQVDQKAAENRSNVEKRGSEMQQAKADLAKAELQLRKGPVLGEVERLKNEAMAEDARSHVASLEKSHRARERSDAAALRILELQRNRQKVALERAERNMDRLVVKAPLSGMVAHENTWRSGSVGPPQEGDQMYPGQPLLRIFDPSEMGVLTLLGEPDGAILAAGAKATVRLDAYPELVFEAHLKSASPVAAPAIGSPIKRFSAWFLLERSDPHLLPDLSAAVIIQGEQPRRKEAGS